MSAEALVPYITPEAYLQFEKTALTKHEYDDGVVVATPVLVPGAEQQ